MTLPQKSRRWPLLVPLSVWILAYPPLALLDHYSLETNAFDLSVFDYALWSSLQGEGMQVPFLGQSLLSHHFMPSLWTLLPVYGAVQSPVTLIGLQLVFMAGAAVILWRLAAGRIPDRAVAVLLTAFLFSRRSHSAVTSVFYIESLEPLLVFAVVFAASSRRWWLYWTAVVLALGCKEDMALYVGGFSLVLAIATEHRRTALVTAILAVAWLAASVLVAIPDARERDRLPRENPFIEARFGEEGQAPSPSLVIQRVASFQSLEKVFNVASAVAFSCLAAPVWLIPAVPGFLINLAASPTSLQATFTGHYLWPILPWVFLAGLMGLEFIHKKWPRRAMLLVRALLLVVLVDWPGWRVLAGQPASGLSEAALVRSQLAVIPDDASLLAQPNLIPHVPHRREIAALGREVDADVLQSHVLLTLVGDTWPLDRDQVGELIERYRQDSRYETLVEGPLFAFRSLDGVEPRVSR